MPAVTGNYCKPAGSKAITAKNRSNRSLPEMERMSELIPVVIKQAHERIIGGRQVKNAEKVLSVYEPDAQVIVRGKAGQEVEFGNTLFLGESVEGYLLDWKLYGSRTPSENEQMQESLQRQNRFNLAEPIAAMCADRGIRLPAGPPAVSPGGHLRWRSVHAIRSS